MDESAALPRKNGELVFAAPWETRAFGLAVALNESGAYPWRDFSAKLAKEIAQAESNSDGSTYYERWLVALEDLAQQHGLVRETELEQTRNKLAREDDHRHPHIHQQGTEKSGLVGLIGCRKRKICSGHFSRALKAGSQGWRS